jgi:hypothetical protein
MDLPIEDGDIPAFPEAPKPPGRPKGSRKKKLTEVERKDFMNESIRKILENHMSYGEYVMFCRDKHDMSKSQANEYWTRIWGLLKKKFDLEKDKLIVKHTQKYWEIYQQALVQGDLTNARQSLNDLAKLQGLNEAEKVHITGTSIKLNFGEPQE